MLLLISMIFEFRLLLGKKKKDGEELKNLLWYKNYHFRQLLSSVLKWDRLKLSSEVCASQRKPSEIAYTGSKSMPSACKQTYICLTQRFNCSVTDSLKLS